MPVQGCTLPYLLVTNKCSLQFTLLQYSLMISDTVLVRRSRVVGSQSLTKVLKIKKAIENKKEVNSEKHTCNEGGGERREGDSYEAGEIDSEDIGGDDNNAVMAP